MPVKKLQDGTWQVDVSDGLDPVTLKQRRIRRRGYRTKKEALESEQYIRTVVIKDTSFGQSITIDMLYDLLKEEDIANHRKQSYIQTQDNNYNKHIKNYFSKVTHIQKLKYEDIYNYRETLKEKKAKNSTKPLSANTINKIMILLKKIIDVGVRNGYFNKNPVKQLKKLPIEESKLNFWTIQEFRLFLKLFEENEENLKLLFTVLFFTGMRLGECLALTWNDIDLSRNTIHITKTLYVNKGEVHRTSTKTKAGTRYVVINSKLVASLIDWKEKQTKLLGQFTHDTDELQIFQNSPILITKNAIEKQYKKIRNRNPDLKKIRIHDFRHSHASLLINNGEDYHVVKERLGHASITTTIDTYSHLYPSKQEDLADKLDNLI